MDCSNSGFACLSTNLRVNGHLYLYKNAVRFNNKEFTFNYKFLSKNVGEAISERASILNNPGLWALVFDDILVGGFLGMLVFVGIMELSVLYAAKKGLLTWK